jgi:hypothetical protein
MEGRFVRTACPTGEEQHVAVGQLMLAVAPRNFLDNHGLASQTIHAPHGVEEENEETPKGNELKTPFAEFIVTRCGLMTTRTDRRGAPPWAH